MAQWPSYVQANILAFDNYFYGDVDGDGVMDRLPPNTVAPNYLNMPIPPQPVSYTPYFYLADIRCSI
jgi:alpha-1,3-glucan synthase